MGFGVPRSQRNLVPVPKQNRSPCVKFSGSIILVLQLRCINIYIYIYINIKFCPGTMIPIVTNPKKYRKPMEK